MQFTQNPAVSESRAGGKYSLYGGIIEGEYLEVQENKRIVMNWRFKDWGSVYSNVVIDFEADEDDVRENCLCL